MATTVAYKTFGDISDFGFERKRLRPECVMPKSQQVAKIRQYLSNRGADIDVLDLVEDWVDPTVMYETNKAEIVSRVGFGTTRKPPSNKEMREMYCNSLHNQCASDGLETCQVACDECKNPAACKKAERIKKEMEYPNFMSFKVADEVLKFKTATKYLDEQISKILKCPICSKTTNKKCWEFKWGTGVEIFWYVPQKKAKPKIPTCMTLQKSLTKTGGQMYFKNGGGKKKTKVLNKKKTKKKVKKGSDNLMTFGIRMPNVKTLEDMLK